MFVSVELLSALGSLVSLHGKAAASDFAFLGAVERGEVGSTGGLSSFENLLFADRWGKVR